jgi:hypothetical protein
VKNTKYNNSAVSVATLQRVKSFCDYIQLFCSMTDGKFELREIEIIIHNPVFIDTNLLETMTPHVTAFANILRIAQTEPQDWFDFVVHRKTENGAAPEICFNEFETELLKLCSEVGHSPLSEEALQTLFNFIKGNRSDDCFGLWELAIAFAKFRLPAAKIRSANIVASQFRNFAMFLKEARLSLKDIGGFSLRNVQSGLVSPEELNSMFNNLLVRKETCDEHDMSLASSCEGPTTSHSVPSLLKANTALLLAEEEDSTLFGNPLPLTLPIGKEPESAQDKDALPTPLPTTVPQKQVNFSLQDTIKTSSNLSITPSVGKNQIQNDDVLGSHKPEKRRSFLEAVTESVLRSIGGTGISGKYSKPQEQSPKQKRSSFFSLKRNSIVVPVADDEDQLNSSSDPSKSVSNTMKTSTNSRSSVRSSFLDAIQLRSQLANFLHPDEQEQFKYISNGVITIKHGSNPASAIQGGLFPKEEVLTPQQTTTALGESQKRRRYSSLIAMTDDWDGDLLTDPEVLEKLWVSIHRQSHQRRTPTRNKPLRNSTESYQVDENLEINTECEVTTDTVSTPTRYQLASREENAAILKMLTSPQHRASYSSPTNHNNSYSRIMKSFDSRLGSVQRLVSSLKK